VNDDFFDSLLRAVEGFMTGMAKTDMQAENGTGVREWAGTAPASAPPAPAQESGSHGFGSIRDADPAFDIQAFLVRVGEMFSAYHAALDRGDLAPVRRFVDETSWQELEREAHASGVSPSGPRTLYVKAIRPMTATHEDGLDMVRVLISADVVGQAEPICEYWELIRKRGTLTKPGLTITKCPNCGAPVDGDDPSRCAYCGTRLADPALDWVVRKIAAQ
jgi:predicted lipid-binding transport protein (Tim44 family)